MPIIEVKDVTYVYCPKTPYEKKALDTISMDVESGEFLGLVGANGSGKSTLVQHFNGLLLPTTGSIRVCGKAVSDKQHQSELWKRVGLVMQYPEQQIFEATVFEDVSFGPRNMGLTNTEVRERTLEALTKVGLDEAIVNLPPLCLSGGMRRRVAIAGVLAMKPEILILDEPTAGLDPAGREMILRQLKQIQVEENTTIIMISHNLKEVLLVADRLAVLEKGKLVAFGDIREVLSHQYVRELEYINFPDYLRVIYSLAQKGQNINTNVYSLADAEIEIDKFLKGKKNEPTQTRAIHPRQFHYPPIRPKNKNYL
ncbi:Energy-coupling factor transporter ATP-binding protein EcfA2 [Sporomusa ovata DSM 2662]|uniref:Energy-coupling factor transporter ATP-binding protein EcfA2 n=1 Tax=Sporomusa ovata TaxID=2378 RepID=A0A0U1KSC5_9FIRM|nr:energy-coupling factor transporter ATPase [Sporomusa ovata]EQB26253.1 ABC-type cobalt transport system, ATPase component [Sporomusa ovata DSM 2662]CQR70330.1 ATPase component of general energizing module of ECF transporters [Sporomusa ovata]